MTSPQPTTWTVHLAARRPGKTTAALVLIVIALFAVAGLVPRQWGVGGLMLMLLLAGALLVGSIAEFLFPVTYTLDADGAHVRLPGSHRLLAWGRVRRVERRRDGIKLSPLLARNWVESYRGVFLRASGSDTIMEQVRAWLDAAGVTPVIGEER